jgi:hypothetical protein
VTGRQVVERSAKQFTAGVADDLLGAQAVSFDAEGLGVDVGARVDHCGIIRIPFGATEPSRR